MAESLFAEASQRLDAALHHISISEDALCRLKFPKSSLQVSIPVRMDNGSLQVFQGYRVRYDDTRGPTKGGIRYHPSVNGYRIGVVCTGRLGCDSLLMNHGTQSVHNSAS